MPRLTPQPVPIELDKHRNLLLDLNAAIAFREATGREMLDFFMDAAEEMGALVPQNGGEPGRATYAQALKLFSPDVIRGLVYAGLKHEDEGLTIREVGSMIGFSNMNYVIERLNVAMRAAMMGKGEPEPEEEPQSAGASA